MAYRDLLGKGDCDYVMASFFIDNIIFPLKELEYGISTNGYYGFRL